MKIFKSLVLAAAVFTAFFSCQKELAFDNSGASAGSLKKDASGNCLTVSVNGIYVKDSVLTTANFVDVQVNVSFPGTFDIKSDTLNGYSFSKTGSVVLGANTIRLYASGKPVAGGVTNTFTVKYGTSTCSFDITVPGTPPPPADFTLGTTLGVCTGAIVAGSYTAGTLLTSANTLTIQVNVISPGAYTISTSIVNGFKFTGTGIFTSAIPAVQNVTLTASGTPTAAGTTNVAVTTNATTASTCNFDITVVPAAAPAVFTLDGAPGGICTAFTLAGSYIVGSISSASNTVKLNVTVTAAGPYSISTNSANGITFSGTGTLALGAQQITLTASGTPVAAGPFVFKPNITSTCDFTVTFAAAPPVPSGDYFPLTLNSWWSYDIVGQPDTLYNVAYGTKLYNGGNNYTEIEQNYGGVPTDTGHYRKSGNNYFQWVISDFYSAQFAFDNPAIVDINFLKENTATGTTWASSTYTGTIGGGIAAANLYYDFKIENANTSIVVNGKTYTNVIYVSVTVQLKVAPSPVFTAFEKNDFYYAKGIGLVKVKYNDLIGGMVLGEVDIRNYKVN